MKKTITICDKCKREIPEGKSITRSISTSTNDMRTEDVCRSCAYTMGSSTFYVGGCYPEVTRYKE